MIFYLTRPLLIGEVPHPLLNPTLLRREGLKAWPAGPVRANKLSPLRVARGVLTQQKVNFVDSRLRSAEHSSELDALLSLARELRLSKR